MDLLSLDHLHFSVPDLERAQQVHAPFHGGEFTPTYGGAGSFRRASSRWSSSARRASS